jgi:twinfilin-like protein
MAKSGITVKDDLRQKLYELSEQKETAWIQLQIDEEPTFKFLASGAKSDAKTEFDEMRKRLPAKEPSYFLYRIADQNKWVTVFYVPDISKVKDRMVYASSVAELQKGFGQSKFVPVSLYRISEPKECTWEAYAKSIQAIDSAELMTSEELLAKEARHDSVNAVAGSKVSAIVGMPVKVQDGATGYIEQVKNRELNTVILQLNNETEVLERVDSGNYTLEEISKKMTRQEPRFIIHNFQHASAESKSEIVSAIFFYYCPDGAKPRLKMFYSSCKNVVQQMVASQLTIAKSLECSEPAEISTNNVLTELYPQVEKAAGFKKPVSKAGKRGMIGGIKFSASKSPVSSPAGEDVQSPSSAPAADAAPSDDIL